MKITEVEVARTTKPIPLPMVYKPAWRQPDGLEETEYGFAYYKIHTDEGITGIGPYGGNPDAYIISVLEGMDPFFIEKFWSGAMSGRELTYNRGTYGGLEVALWDIVGKAAGLPVYKLLGPYKDKVRAYAATGRLLSPEEHIDQAHQIIDKGFTAMKLRLHRPDRADDIAVVSAVRKSVGDKIDIIVDANQNHISMAYDFWSLETALDMARELEDLGVLFLEEPLAVRDFEGLRKLAAAVKIPISGGEHCANFYKFKEHVDADTYDILQPDVTLGDIGITGTRKIANYAGAQGKSIVPHVCGLGSFSVNFHAMLQAVVTVENCPLIEYPYDPPLLTDESQQMILKEPVTLNSDGTVSPPDKPGIGVEIDEEVWARYA